MYKWNIWQGQLGAVLAEMAKGSVIGLVAIPSAIVFPAQSKDIFSVRCMLYLWFIYTYMKLKSSKMEAVS